MRRTYCQSGAFAVIAATAAIALAGCGGAKSPSVATVATTAVSGAAGSTNATGGAAGSSSPPSQAQLQQSMLKYARCMRSSGVPSFPDPTGGGFEIPAGSGVDPSSPAFKTAQAKCRKVMPDSGGPPLGSTTHPSPQWFAHMLKVSQCMRRNGISDFPDPMTSVPSNPFPAGSPGGVISDIDGAILVFPATLDTQSPLFTRAAKACDFPLHNH